jgi:predicted DNA-binding transcriptional regulator YafY
MLSKEELETITEYDQFTKFTTLEDDDSAIKFRKIIDKLLMALPEDQTNSLPFSPTPNGKPDFTFGGTIQLNAEINHLISKAIINKEVIEIEYWISDNRKWEKQKVEPLYTFFQRHHYYLLAWKNDNHDKPGIYSINRFKKVNNTGKHFDIPTDFKVSNYIKKEVDVSPADNKLFHFELSFPKEVASEAIEKTYYHNQHTKLCEDGTVYVSFRSTQLHGVFYWVLSEGHKVKVLNPPELVNMIKREAQRIVQYYK